MITPVCNHYEIEWMPDTEPKKGALLLTGFPESKPIRLALIKQIPINQKFDLWESDAVYVQQAAVLEIDGRLFIHESYIVARYTDK